MYNKEVRGVLIKGNKTYGQITSDVLAPQERRAPTWWFIAMFVSTVMMFIGLWAIYTTISVGIGTWGVNNSIAWGMGYHQFCMVGGNWSCRNCLFYIPVDLATKVADIH